MKDNSVIICSDTLPCSQEQPLFQTNNKYSVLYGLGAGSRNQIDLSFQLAHLLLTHRFKNKKTIKLLLAYTSRINPLDSVKTTVAFSRADLKEILHINKVRMDEMKEIADDLSQPLSWVYQDSTGKKKVYDRVNLFYRVGFFVDENNVEAFYMECSKNNENLELFYNLKKYVHLAFDFLQKTSNDETGVRITLLVIYILTKLGMRHSLDWYVGFDELKSILLHGEGIKSLGVKPGNFNQTILLPAIDFINNNTDLTIALKAKQTGRCHMIVGYHFNVYRSIKEKDSFLTPEDFETYDEYIAYLYSLDDTNRAKAELYVTEIKHENAIKKTLELIDPYLDQRFIPVQRRYISRIIVDYNDRIAKLDLTGEHDIDSYGIEDIISIIQEHQEKAQAKILKNEVRREKFGSYVIGCLERDFSI